MWSGAGEKKCSDKKILRAKGVPQLLDKAFVKTGRNTQVI